MSVTPTPGGKPPVPESAVVGHGVMSGKPVMFRDAAAVINMMNHGFKEKQLCDGPVMNLGDSCVFSCEYCYVEGGMRASTIPIIRKYNEVHNLPNPGTLHFRDVVTRRRKNESMGALEVLRDQIQKGLKGSDERKVLFTSSTVEVAANNTLLEETAAACTMVLEATQWDIRILSKSPLAARLVSKELIPARYHHRLIFGFSLGTLDDKLAAAIETGTPLVKKRLEALHWLQDYGFRTFGMICPSLPQTNYEDFSSTICEAVRVEKCEHVWAEVINVRAGSFTRTYDALVKHGFTEEAERIKSVSGDGCSENWEAYARATFEAHTKNVPAAKLRFLQYTSKRAFDWWVPQQSLGAVLIGSVAAENLTKMKTTEPLNPDPDTGRQSIIQHFVGSGYSVKDATAETDRLDQEWKQQAIDGLRDEQRKKLEKLEETIRRGLSAGISAAKALYEIHTHDDGIYWRKQYKSFELYCWQRWGYRKAHAFRLRDAGEFIHDLDASNQQSPNGDKPRPSGEWYPRNESHIRPILKVRREDRITCWNSIMESSKAENLTAAIVEEKTKVAVKKLDLTLKPKVPRILAAKDQRIAKTIDRLSMLVSSTPKSVEILGLLQEIRKLV